MGGKGSGGKRVGAGRKPLDASVGAVRGSRRARARAKKSGNQTGVEHAPVDLVTAAIETEVPQPPGSLTLDELAEWNDLAPRAAKQGTLTADTLLALRDLCQARVLKDKLLRTVSDEGVTVASVGGALAAHPLLSRFTTLLQRVDAGMARFKLAPMGQSLAPEAEKPADPFAAFDGAAPLSPDVVGLKH